MDRDTAIDSIKLLEEGVESLQKELAFMENKTELLQEDIECVHIYLDKMDIQRIDGIGKYCKTLSIIDRFKILREKELAGYKEAFNKLCEMWEFYGEKVDYSVHSPRSSDYEFDGIEDKKKTYKSGKFARQIMQDELIKRLRRNK